MTTNDNFVFTHMQMRQDEPEVKIEDDLEMEQEHEQVQGSHEADDDVQAPSTPSCADLRLGHHILECGHRVLVPEMWIDTTSHISPCSGNCAVQEHIAEKSSAVFLCQECFATDFFRRYQESGDFTTEQAMSQCKGMIDQYWGIFETDGMLLIGTNPATESTDKEDEAMASLLGGMQLKEQDTAGILEAMGSLSL